MVLLPEPAAPIVLELRLTHMVVLLAEFEAPLSIHAYNGTFPLVEIGALAVNSTLVQLEFM